MNGRVVAGKYELDVLLGEGGVGQVWRASHRVTKRAHAVKLISAPADGDPSLQRFLREAETSARVRHPGVVEIQDAGRDADGTLYLVMELLVGRTYREWLDVPGRSPWQGADLLREALEPLMAAHEALGPDGRPAPIVHRDMKPANLFILDQPAPPAPGSTRPTRVKVLDFGIARWVGAQGPTAIGVTLGTPLYTSPEQIKDPRSVTARADVWSMGVMLHETFSGSRPFEGRSYFEVVAKIWEDPPPALPAWAPAPLAQLVAECLAKDPGARPADARALAVRMDVLLAEAASTAVPASAISRPSRPSLEDVKELGTVPTEIVLPLVRARSGGSESGLARRVDLAQPAAPATSAPAPAVVTVPASRDARRAAGLAPGAPLVPDARAAGGLHDAGPRAPSPHDSGARPSLGGGVIPVTRAQSHLPPAEQAAYDALRRNAPMFTGPRDGSEPVAAATGTTAAPASSAGGGAAVTSAAASGATAPSARRAFVNDDVPDASALPGYGRPRVLIALSVLTLLGAAGAGIAWYLGALP